MQRPAGLRLAAILLTVFAVLWVVMSTPLITVAVTYGYRQFKNNNSISILYSAAQAIVAAFAILMGYAALALARNKNSGRIAGAISGALIALAELPVVLIATALALAPNRFSLPVSVRIGIAIEALFSIAAVVVGISLIVYLNLQHVKVWFTGTTYYLPATDQALSLSSGAGNREASSHSYIPLSMHMPREDTGPRVARIVVSVFAVLCLIASAVLLMYVKWKIPVTLLGIRLQGRAAAEFHIAFAIVDLAIAIGLLRRIPIAYGVTLLLEVAGTINRLLLLIPAYRLRASAFYVAHSNSWRHYSASTRLLKSAVNSTLFILSLSMSAFFLWALWRDLAAIRKSREASAMEAVPG